MSAQQAARFATEVLKQNHDGKFRLDVEQPDVVARAFRLLGCRATQDLFRTDVIHITPAVHKELAFLG